MQAPAKCFQTFIFAFITLAWLCRPRLHTFILSVYAIISVRTGLLLRRHSIPLWRRRGCPPTRPGRLEPALEGEGRPSSDLDSSKPSNMTTSSAVKSYSFHTAVC